MEYGVVEWIYLQFWCRVGKKPETRFLNTQIPKCYPILHPWEWSDICEKDSSFTYLFSDDDNMLQGACQEDGLIAWWLERLYFSFSESILPLTIARSAVLSGIDAMNSWLSISSWVCIGVYARRFPNWRLMTQWSFVPHRGQRIPHYHRLSWQ